MWSILHSLNRSICLICGVLIYLHLFSWLFCHLETILDASTVQNLEWKNSNGRIEQYCPFFFCYPHGWLDMCFSVVLEEEAFHCTPFYCRGLFSSHMRQSLDHVGECITHHHRSPSATARPFGGNIHSEWCAVFICWTNSVSCSLGGFCHDARLLNRVALFIEYMWQCTNTTIRTTEGIVSTASYACCTFAEPRMNKQMTIEIPYTISEVLSLYSRYFLFHYYVAVCCWI